MNVQSCHTVETNGDARETGKLMRYMVERYYKDVIPYAHFSLWEFFNYVSNIPFNEDPVHIETLQRPAITLSQSGPGGDCDDKAIVLASWCRLHGGRYNPGTFHPKKYDYRFIAVRRSDYNSLHHVYCEIYIDNRFIHADPTYNFNTLGRARENYIEYVII